MITGRYSYYNHFIRLKIERNLQLKGKENNSPHSKQGRYDKLLSIHRGTESRTFCIHLQPSLLLFSFCFSLGIFKTIASI